MWIFLIKICCFVWQPEVFKVNKDVLQTAVDGFFPCVCTVVCEFLDPCLPTHRGTPRGVRGQCSPAESSSTDWIIRGNFYWRAGVRLGLQSKQGSIFTFSSKMQNGDFKTAQVILCICGCCCRSLDQLFYNYIILGCQSTSRPWDHLHLLVWMLCNCKWIRA